MHIKVSRDESAIVINQKLQLITPLCVFVGGFMRVFVFVGSLVRVVVCRFNGACVRVSV